MSTENKYGTFSGVFIPSLLTILGVIMYLRLPVIIGETGIWGAIGIIVVAHCISLITGLSISSIATDKKAESGGRYYMISRSLGLPVGGTLGLALYAGLSLSISLYILGFAESFVSYFAIEPPYNHVRIAGTLLLVLLTSLMFLRPSTGGKLQYIVILAIVLSLVSIFFGHHELAPNTIDFRLPASGKFLLFFGIFFPAVIGFESGISMRPLLKHPGKSIPAGVIGAILAGLAVYVGLAFFLAYRVSSEALTHDRSVLLHISLMPELVIAGIWLAALSSAVICLRSAPRILEATASDKITSQFFDKGTGKSHGARNAMLVTLGISELGILAGDFDAIARIVSIFFITAYGFLNLSYALKAWTSPGFRPDFKTPLWVSAAGAILCFGLMIAMDLRATIASVLVFALLFFYFKRKELALQSGDTWSGLWASLVKAGLQRLSSNKVQSSAWRPNILMFNGAEEVRPYMLETGTAIAGDLGILSSFEMVQSDEAIPAKVYRPAPEGDEETRYFHYQHVCRNVFAGMDEVARVYGFAGLEPNTVLMGWSKKEKNKDAFLRLIKSFEKNDYSSLFLSYHPQRKFGDHKTIDVWWSGWGKNLSLAANLLKHLITSDAWKHAKMRLHVILNDITQIEKAYNDLARVVDHFQVPLEIKIVNNSVDQLSRTDLIVRESGNTGLTIIGIPDKKYEDLEQTYDEVNEISALLGTTLFINASSVFEEYDLGLREESIVETRAFDQEIVLPEVLPSRYPAIADDIVKIDEHGRNILEIFYEKAFVPYFNINNELFRELLELIATTRTSFEKLGDRQSSLRADYLFRIRRHFFEESENILGRYVSSHIDAQRESLQNGISWYISQLNKDILRFPQRLTIRYHREDFNVSESDTAATKWFKLKKRMLSPFPGKFISGTIRYREIAAYYLRDNRYHFLSAWLDDFHQSALGNLEKILLFIQFTDEQFEKLTRNPEREQWCTAGESIYARMSVLKEDNDRLAKLNIGRLLVEFRRNVQLLNKDLEQINVNSLIATKRAGKKYYQALEERDLSFSKRWSVSVIQAVNKIRASVMVRSFRWQLLHDIKDFVRSFERVVSNKIINPVAETKVTLAALADTPDNTKTVQKIEWRVQQDALVKDFDELSERLTDHIRSLPEELVIPDEGEQVIADGGPEGIAVPLDKVLKHFLETSFLGPFEEGLNHVLERTKRIVFNINDQLSLVLFNIDNVDKEEPDRKGVVKGIVAESIKEISKEESMLNEFAPEMDLLAQRLAGDLFAPLSEYKLARTTADFTHLVRDYQSKRVLGLFGKFSKHVQEFFRKKVLILLYSKSEGILLAQRLAESNEVKSINERTLDVADKVTPEGERLNQLPHYYQNLFSGRSSIGENFWVARNVEERQAVKAMDRYRSGHRGGILVLGERNSGKTAFCRFITDKHGEGRKAFHLFSGQDGSTKPADFVHELGRLTGISSDLDGIMNALPGGTIIVIHDFELWWERSLEGMDVVRMIMNTISKYAGKILFIINMNPFAYELINAMEKIHDRFIGIVRSQPFTSMELKNLIMTRHRSSGVTFLLGDKDETKLSEIRLARLFNQFFNYSDGNPGVAMQAWLNSIQKVSGKTISIKAPARPSVDVLFALPPSWNVVLIQLILHKRMSTGKLQRVLDEPHEIILQHLLALVRAGLIKERVNGLYTVNPHMEPLLIDVFKKKEWL